MKKAIATIDADVGTMTIFYCGAGHPLTAETDSVCEELEYTPNSIDDAVDSVSAMYSNGDWCLEWVEDDGDAALVHKFEIYTDHFEFRFPGAALAPSASADEIWAWYQEESCNQPNLEASFDTIEEAKAEFQKNYENYGRTSESRAFAGTPLLVGDVAYLEENIYDDNGEFIQSVCIWNYSTAEHEGSDS